MSTRRHSAPPAGKSGTLTSIPIDSDKVRVLDTVRCVHCQYTSVWVPHSETWWAFCTRCNGFVCGRVACRANGCVHWEQQLENMEAGRRLDFAPTMAAVPRSVGGVLLG